MSGKTFPMEIPDQLRCLFAGTVEERDDSYVGEIPQNEVQPGETYCVALLPTLSTDESEQSEGDLQSERGPVEPPVAEGFGYDHAGGTRENQSLIEIDPI